MTENSVQRRLAAIMAADVVGYSHLMGEDEARTLATVRRLRTVVIEPSIARHQGRLFKAMGDGFLVEFPSAVNAVACAAAIQQAIGSQDLGLPDGKGLLLRIGIHLGDVVVEGGDVYGDGVNIAARLEGLASPGSIAISAVVHDNIGGRLDLDFQDMGEQQLKNITRPIRVYHLKTSAGPAVTPVRPEQVTPTIAVLPFNNMSGDPEQEYFSDGITEDIITELSRFKNFHVTARNSSFVYKAKAVDVRKVGSELRVRFVVEGSVRRSGSRLRVTAQLIDASSGNHLWSERYDRDISDVFAVQDDVTRTIVATLVGQVHEAEMGSAARRTASNVAAYDYVLRGAAYLRGYGEDDNQLARQAFEQAVAIDPSYAAAHAFLALALLNEHGYEKALTSIKERALEGALIAVRIEPRDGFCQRVAGQAYFCIGSFDLALSHLERAATLNPNDANSMVCHADILSRAGQAEEACELIRQAMRLNPLHPEWYWADYAATLFDARQYEEALKAGLRSPAGKKVWLLMYMAAACVQLGRSSDAQSYVGQIMSLAPSFRIADQGIIYRRTEDADHLNHALRKAGLPD